jgi:hypothetical protein
MSGPDFSARELWRDACDAHVCIEIGDVDGLKAAILRLAVFQPEGPPGKRAVLDAFRRATLREICAHFQTARRPAPTLREAS